MQRLQIILADDHPILRSGVRALLERSGDFQVVAEVGSPDELLTALSEMKCDLLLTDFSMPGGQAADGLQLLDQIMRRWPKLPVIVLTMVSNLGVLRSILNSGAKGLVEKAAALSELPVAVQSVMKGRNYCSTDLAKRLQNDTNEQQTTGLASLSPRESEVLRLFSSGKTVAEIAEHLNRSNKTISRQKMDAMAKLGLKTDLDVYTFAREHGLLQ